MPSTLHGPAFPEVSIITNGETRPKAIVFPSPALDKDLRFYPNLWNLAFEWVISGIYVTQDRDQTPISVLISIIENRTAFASGSRGRRFDPSRWLHQLAPLCSQAIPSPVRPSLLRDHRQMDGDNPPPARVLDENVGALIPAADILPLERLVGGHAAVHNGRISVDSGLHVVKRKRYDRALPGLSGPPGTGLWSRRLRMGP